LFEEIAGRFFSNPKKIVKTVSYGMLAVLLFNIFGPIIMGL
jgi:hypothetical protein